MDSTRHHGKSLPYDDPERREWQNPEAILGIIGLKSGDTFADIGCGGGFFALPAARIVGENGKVYGIDTNERAISELKDLAAREGLQNLVLTAGKAENSIPCRHCADIVFFGISLHDFEDPPRVLKNAMTIVKPVGKLIDLDWKKAPMAFGPPQHIRFDETMAARLIAEAGFRVKNTQDSGFYHYLITAVPA